MKATRSGARRALSALLLVGGAGALIALVLLPRAPEERAPRRTAVAPSSARRVKVPLAPDEAEVTVRCHGELEGPLDAESARLRAAVRELDRPDASVTDLQDLGSVLTRLLSERPELGRPAVETLSVTRDRRVLFQLSRALRAVVGVDGAHDALLALVADAARTDEQREAAVLALAGRGDERACAAFEALLADEGAGVLARSAAAYGLSRDVEQLSPARRSAAQTRARALVARPDLPSRLRAESFDLLGRAGLDANDRLVAREAAAGAEEDVAFAAARALLTAGEDRSTVARALRVHATDPVLLAQLDLLEGKKSP